MPTASDYIESRVRVAPRIIVVLGSGLGAFADALDLPSVIYYSEIPGWPQSTAVGHAGKLVVGLAEGVPVAALSGRVHLYEGYTAQQVVYGIRALGHFNIKSVVLTNAAGGVNRDYKPGQLVLISDHINLLGQNPLTGPNDDSLGPRFPDMSEAYSKAYREIAREAGKDMGIDLAEGVYAAVPGPSYETPAEIRYLRTIGADLVGMSTVPETITANHMGLKVLGISCVTNHAAGVIDLAEGVYAAVPGPSYETPAEIRYLRTIGADLVGMSTVPETIAANHMGLKVLGISCVTNHAAGVIDRKLDHKEVLEVGERMKGTLIDLLRRTIPRLDKS